MQWIFTLSVLTISLLYITLQIVLMSASFHERVDDFLPHVMPINKAPLVANLLLLAGVPCSIVTNQSSHIGSGYVICNLIDEKHKKPLPQHYR